MSFHEADEYTVSNLINDKRFYGLSEITDNIIEVETIKSRVKFDAPVQIGFFVLEYGKKLLISFYYDFLVKFLAFDSFCLIQCDTDSLYMSLSDESFFLCVKKELRGEFISVYDKWMSRDYCDFHKHDFFVTVFAGLLWEPKECCKIAAKYHLRQPGLFHLENVSKGVVALCSKAYYCFGDNPKVSCKGISKRHNSLSETDYLKVLFDQTFYVGENRGFRVKNESMYTYSQKRRGLTYMYGKRVVDPDHFTTHPTLL